MIHGIDGPFPGCPVEEACETNCSVERDMYDDQQDSWTRSGAYLTDLVTADEIEPIGERLLGAIEEPFWVFGTELRITASVGGAAHPDDGLDEATLMKQADIAMYDAKGVGGNRFCRASA